MTPSSVLQDIRALQVEVHAFRAKLKETDDLQVQNISSIVRRIDKEAALLETANQAVNASKHVNESDSSDEDGDHGMLSDVQQYHVFQSTNTPDLIRMWRLTRSLPALFSFNSLFHSFSRQKNDSVTVDIVYRRGHAWIIRSSLKYRPLLNELLNLPFKTTSIVSQAPADDELMNDEIFLGDTTDEEEEEGDLFGDYNLSCSKIGEVARKVLEVAGNNLKLGSIPHVSIYFPRLVEECRSEEDIGNVNRLFNYLERLGITCITEIGAPLSFEANVGLQMKDDFGNEPVQLADNAPIHLDLTTLFVLCSDISNVNLSELKDTHKALSFQMQEEATVPCLRDRLFPLLQANRPLICTPIARQRFFEIVSELGSVYEQQRAALLFAEHDTVATSSLLSQISIHAWPMDIRWPIVVYRFSGDTNQPNVPLRADFKTQLSQECFENGWHGRMLTLSANLQGVKTFREALFSWPADVRPRPAVYLHAARSLTMYERTANKVI